VPRVTIPLGSKAPQGAGHPFRFGAPFHPRGNDSLGRAAGCRSEAAARGRGTLRLEGKEYVVQDGDVDAHPA